MLYSYMYTWHQTDSESEKTKVSSIAYRDTSAAKKLRKFKIDPPSSTARESSPPPLREVDH